MDRTFSETLLSLAQKGVRYATVFDLGCADGQFFVDHFAQGLFQEAVPVNIDANAIYEESLQAVRETFGGHYRIAAVSDATGEIELTTSVHPYWSSLRPSNDLYWERINKLASGRKQVPALRLDDLVAELRLAPPYLVKLDIQGAEAQALRGARRMLADTNVVICEADIADFQTINGELVAAGFDLYDITVVNRLADQTLGWFYPVYLSNRLAHLKPRRFWRDSSNEAVIQRQIERREHILERLKILLPQIRAAKAARKSG
ncbi:MAG TPA: FkbM family methyltransferase [Stellaceae bacterium]|jgi:FkbM family methyltransferase